MWISRQINKAQPEPSIQGGRVTLNSKGNLEAVSTGVDRSVDVYSPYGYSFSLPTGADMLLANIDGRQCAIGVKMDELPLETGEIKIKSSSGAYIYLKKDGSVEINGLIISKAGEIKGYANQE